MAPSRELIEPIDSAKSEAKLAPAPPPTGRPRPNWCGSALPVFTRSAFTLPQRLQGQTSGSLSLLVTLLWKKAPAR